MGEGHRRGTTVAKKNGREERTGNRNALTTRQQVQGNSPTAQKPGPNIPGDVSQKECEVLSVACMLMGEEVDKVLDYGIQRQAR
jgi:hypothetical protein